MRFLAPGGWLASTIVLFVCCKGGNSSTSVSGARQRNTSCDIAHGLREQAVEWHSNGKLDRTRRTLHKANRLCPEEAAWSFGLELQTLGDLGMQEEALVLARQVSNSSGANPQDKAQAASLLAAGALGNPSSGDQLLQEGLAKKAQGDSAAAQRLFDRARVALERKATDRAILEPKGGLWDVSAMAWAGDGTKLAVAAGTDIHILRSGDYQEILRLPADALPVVGVACSPDSQTLAASATDHGIALWNLRSGSRSGSIEFARGRMRTLLFSPDGQLLAGRDEESSNVELWTVATRTHLRTLDMSFGDLWLPGVRGSTGDAGLRPAMFAFSPNGASVLGTRDNTLALWSLRSDKTGVSRLFKTKAPGPNLTNQEFTSVAYHPDGRTAAAGTESGQILLWNMAKGTTIRSMQAHKFNPQVAFSRDGSRLLSASGDGMVRSFVASSLTPLRSYDTKIAWASAISFHPDGRSVAIAGEGALVIQDGVSGKLTKAIRPEFPISAIAVSRNASHLAMGTTAGAVVVFSVSDGSLVRLMGHKGEITSLAFSPDGRSLVSASLDKDARVWDVGTWKGLRVLVHPQGLHSVAYRADGRILATAGDDGGVHLWDTTSGKGVAVLPGSRCGILSVGFSPDGSMLFANTADHALLRWDASTYARLAHVEREYNCSSELHSWENTLGWTADGKMVASAPSGDSVELWNAQTGQLQGSLTESGHSFHVRSVTVSPRDPIVVAAGGEKIRVWQLPGKTALPDLTAPNGADTLVFSADGRFLFGASRRGAVSIWAMPSGALQVTLKLVDDSNGFARSQNGLVEWLGPQKPAAACKLGERLYPAELCEERYTASALIRSALSGQGLPTMDD